MAQLDETGLFLTEPDRPPAPQPDVGIHAWPVGGFMPMGFYRPVPIVRLTGVIVFQSVAHIVLYAALIDLSGLATVGAGALLAVVLARRAGRHWLGRASTAWKVATLTALTVNVLLIGLASLSPAIPADGSEAVMRDSPRYHPIRYHFGGG